MEPQLVVNSPCTVGENPYWHPIEKRIYWVDITPGHIYRHDPARETTEKFEVGEAVGGFTVQPDGQLLLFMARGAVKFWRDGVLGDTVIDEMPEERDSRFNDVIAGPEGRVYCGTMSTPDRKGKLYRLDTDRSVRPVVDEVGTSNGLAFSLDHRTLYYTDTPTLCIAAFDYQQATGEILNRRDHITADDGRGRPDGMTVDAEGCIWSARWDGNCLVRYTPDGEFMSRIEFPVKKVSSLTFGGDDYTDIYVTTAGGQMRDTDGEYAGSLFRVNVGVKGVPELPSRLT